MDQTMLPLNNGLDHVRPRPGDSYRRLSELINDYQDRVLVVPDHQREFVWDDNKVRAWFDRLSLADAGREPVGVIVTYQINGDRRGDTYLNDGSQRVRATLRVLESPLHFGYTAETARSIVRSVMIPVQHRVYANHDEALQDFQLLNLGTTLTPREMCRGILVNAPQYKSWSPLLALIHDAMRITPGGLVTNRGITRLQTHKWERHDFALFVRWLGDEPMAEYNPGAISLAKGDIDEGNTIEHLLREACEERTIEELKRQANMLVAHIQRTTATIRDIWEGIRPSADLGINATLYRWLMDVSIWVRKTQTPIVKWEVFLRAILEHGQGGSTLADPDKPRDRTTLGLSHMGKLKSACRIVGSDMYEGKAPRKRDGRRRLPGYDESHVNPFSTHGNGPTVGEPASRNRARGAKPVVEEED